MTSPTRRSRSGVSKGPSSERTSGRAISEWTPHRPAPGLEIWQTEKFRYSADAFWLAGFALEHASGSRALDLGTGCGIIAYLLARQGWHVRGIDSEAGWSEGWRRSQAGSDVSVLLERLDVRQVSGVVDLVICNPPYFPSGTGPVASDPLRAAARTEGEAKLADFVSAAGRCLGPGGLAAFIVPRSRLSEMVHPGLHVRHRCFVGRKRALVALSPDEGELREEHLTRVGAQRFYERLGP